jgi:hypothetical protein
MYDDSRCANSSGWERQYRLVKPTTSATLFPSAGDSLRDPVRTSIDAVGSARQLHELHFFTLIASGKLGALSTVR